MRKRLILIFIAITMAIVLAACGGSDNDNELAILDVEFNVPDELDVGETLELKAIVTYGGEEVTEADEVEFEVWEKGDKDNSVTLDSTNHGDGSYTAEYTFEHDGIFEMYAHTTAHDLHTMPKREIIVGEGGDYDEVDNNNDDHNHNHEDNE